MECPYSHLGCPERAVPPGVEACPHCGRFLKSCPDPGCRAPNRAWANYCRSCRTALPLTAGNWLAFRGGPERLGLNAFPPAYQAGDPLEIRDVDGVTQLGDFCRSLLGYDRHLVAVSQSGSIAVIDAGRPTAGLRLKADGPISCEPCIDQGILYLGSPGRLSAYSLGAAALLQPRLEPLWQLALPGTPIQALTALENRLYVTVVNGQRAVMVVDGLQQGAGATLRTLYTGDRPSWLAADPAAHQVAFLSEDAGALKQHTVTHGAGRAEASVRVLAHLPRPFADNVPIALLEGKIFGVFGEEERLCRIDLRSGELEHLGDDDTKLFALRTLRDGVRIDTTGIAFSGAEIRDSFNLLDRVKVSPVLLGDRAAVLGMQDGRLQIYDAAHPPRHEVRRLTGDGEPITALASFHNFVAAGNARGIVKLYELVLKTPPRK
jgi:hypothetical protein